MKETVSQIFQVENSFLIIGFIIFVFALVFIAKSIAIVPQKTAYIVERLGRYNRTLEAGISFIIPFVDKIAYRHVLKEKAIDVPPQNCITKDNISVEIDGVLYLQILDPKKASYGIDNYLYASTQLAQTTLRSEIGKIDLDKTFEERETINANIINVIDKASDPWGIKITRYEISNINPPRSVTDALEKQMRAERERRATVAESEGQKEAKINIAEGEKQEAIKQSEGMKLKQINEAEGKSQEIKLIASATANGIKTIAEAINANGGERAVSLKIAEQYIKEFGNLAQKNNSVIIPTNLSDVAGIVGSLKTIFEQTNKGQSEK